MDQGGGLDPEGGGDKDYFGGGVFEDDPVGFLVSFTGFSFQRFFLKASSLAAGWPK